MKTISRSARDAVLRAVLDDCAASGIARLSSPKIKALSGKLDVPQILRTLSAMQLVALTYESGEILYIRPTSSGRCYFESRSDERASLWSDRRFSLFQTVLSALLSFAFGVVLEYRFALLRLLVTKIWP